MNRSEASDSARSSATNDQRSSNHEEYDLVVLGSGEGGKYLAWTLAKQGKRVAVVERRIHRRLVPEHRLPAQQEHHPQRQGRLLFFRSEEFGISKENVRINMAAVRERKRKMVDGLVQMHLDNYKAAERN